MTIIDLSRLAPPAIIESLSFETILTEMRADLKARYPDWTASELESDPANKLLQVAAYRELTVRQRVNDAARANLLAFATASDLDHLAAFYGVSRNEGESDAALRLRLQNRIQGWANAGGAAHYRFWALSASADVRDAAVSSPAPGMVRITILSRAETGTPTPALLDTVRSMVLRDDVRVLTDSVEVVAATVKPVAVAARVWLYPETPTDVFTQAVAALPSALEAACGLGWDLTRSWLIAQLHPGGVHRVELAAPLADVPCGDAECIALGTVSITLEGRAR